MATLEQVERLRERANVTYDEAREALEQCGNDMLDAMIYLEKNGKVDPPQNGGQYTAQTAEAEQNGGSSSKHSEGYTYDGDFFKRGAKKVWGMFAGAVRECNANMFQVIKNDKIVMSMPVTVLVILVLFAFWIVIPLLVIGMFCGFRYWFHGGVDVNSVMSKAADKVDEIKKEFTE